MSGGRKGPVLEETPNHLRGVKIVVQFPEHDFNEGHALAPTRDAVTAALYPI
jgi:hypothetical protein